MTLKKIKNKRQKGRFGIVGAISTSIDFGILFILHILGFPSVGSNFVSTGFGFIFSFIANRHFTFKAVKGDVRRQIILFFIFTFIGIWGIQPLIIWLVEPRLEDIGLPQWTGLLVAKLLATGVTLVWNYFFYSRVVFKSKPHMEIV